jgi:hypothetical protein
MPPTAKPAKSTCRAGVGAAAVARTAVVLALQPSVREHVLWNNKMHRVVPALKDNDCLFDISILYLNAYQIAAYEVRLRLSAFDAVH